MNDHPSKQLELAPFYLIKEFYVMLLFIPLSWFGCASDLSPSNESLQNEPAGSEESGASEEGIEPGMDSGPWTATIDANDTKEWAFFDLDTGTLVEGDEWDVAFQTTKIKSNSGISGDGGVVVCPMENEDFSTLAEAPSEPCVIDREDGDDDDTKPDYAFLNPVSWYLYDPAGHVISTQPVVYVVTSTEGIQYKVEFLDYYTEAGTPRFITFQWALLEETAEVPEEEAAEEGSETDVEEDENSFLLSPDQTTEWTYLSLQEVPTPVDPEEESWDLAIQGVQFQTNGGTSGEGFGGALVTDSNWEDLEATTTVGFQADAMVPVPGPPGSGEFSGNPVLNEWFDYNMDTHEATPKDVVYVIRKSSGEYAKFQILTYDNDGMKIRSAPIGRDILVYETEVELSSPDSITYLDFDLGITSEPGEMVDGWDMGLSDTVFQTHSGTSGEGLGGALEMSQETLEDITVATGPGCYSGPPDHKCDCEKDEVTCADDNGMWTEQCNCDLPFAVDEWLQDGEEEFSGNAVLTKWENPDMLPLGYIFMVKTADGDYVKLQITDIKEGVLTLNWAFSGAGLNTF